MLASKLQRLVLLGRKIPYFFNFLLQYFQYFWCFKLWLEAGSTVKNLTSEAEYLVTTTKWDLTAKSYLLPEA